MLTIRQEQLDHLAQAMFLTKLDSAFCADLPGFSDLDHAGRIAFLDRGIAAARLRGLRTEQGIASYLLAAWWLGHDFDVQSAELMALFKSSYPEVRKVHAMNAWVHELIGAPADVPGADAKLREALVQTAAWGD